MDLSYILATYFVSAYESIERVKGIEPSYLLENIDIVVKNSVHPNS
jgi:hypothetical protein